MNNVFESIFRFFRHSFYSYRALFGWLNPKVYFLAKLITPVFQLLFFGLIQSYSNKNSDISVYLIANSILLCAYNSLFGVANVISSERDFGTLKILMITPYNKFLLFIGRSFIHVFDALFTVLIGLLTGIVFFKLNFQNMNISYLVLCLLLGIFSTTGLGLLMSSLGLLIRDINLFINLGWLILLTLTGANFPIKNLPIVLQKISLLLPTTRIIKSLELLLSHNYQIQSFFVQEFIIGSVYIIIGYFALRLIEQKARKNGTLSID